jgi:hypothetical protein
MRYGWRVDSGTQQRFTRPLWLFNSPQLRIGTIVERMLAKDCDGLYPIRIV